VVNVASIAGYGWRQNLDGPGAWSVCRVFLTWTHSLRSLESRLCRATQWAGSRRSMDGSFCLLDFTAL
jgi:hypothetical protein